MGALEVVGDGEARVALGEALDILGRNLGGPGNA